MNKNLPLRDVAIEIASRFFHILQPNFNEELWNQRERRPYINSYARREITVHVASWSMHRKLGANA